MSPEKEAKSRRICEALGALACGLVAGVLAGSFPSHRHSDDEAVVAMALSIGSYLAAFGVLDRAALYLFGPDSEWKFNWVAIPFVGAFFLLVNLAWYFDGEFIGLSLAHGLIVMSFLGGIPLLFVMFVFWLGGALYCLGQQNTSAGNLPRGGSAL
jgi:hypothetical protein